MLDLKTSATLFSDTALLSTDVTSLENFDDIVGVFEPKFIPQSVENQNGKYVVCGLVKSLVIYKSSSDLCSHYYSGEVKLEIESENGANLRDFSVASTISSFKVKAGKDLEIMVSLSGSATFDSELSERYVKGFEVKGEKQTGFGGIKVYVTSAGESLFDAARNLNVRPEVISSQNEVSGTFDQGEKIYVYSPVNLA